VLSGVLWVCRKIAETVDREREEEEKQIVARLRELYAELESGQIDERAFDAAESELLARLDALRGTSDDEDEDDDEGAPPGEDTGERDDDDGDENG
jgi:hypothetical protein